SPAVRSTPFPYTTLFRSLRSPREGGPRREVPAAADVRLVLVAQSGAEREVRRHLPVVLHERRDVPLRHGGFGVAARDTELRGPRSEEHTSELQSRVDLVC